MAKTESQVTLKDLATDAPTELTLQQMEQWVVWQFPRPKGRLLCGAVHPPQAEYGWLPALLDPRGGQLVVHAHATDPFTTAEAAANWIAETTIP